MKISMHNNEYMDCMCDECGGMIDVLDLEVITIESDQGITLNLHPRCFRHLMKTIKMFEIARE